MGYRMGDRREGLFFLAHSDIRSVGINKFGTLFSGGKSQSSAGVR